MLRKSHHNHVQVMRAYLIRKTQSRMHAYWIVLTRKNLHRGDWKVSVLEWRGCKNLGGIVGALDPLVFQIGTCDRGGGVESPPWAGWGTRMPSRAVKLHIAPGISFFPAWSVFSAMLDTPAAQALRGAACPAGSLDLRRTSQPGHAGGRLGNGHIQAARHTTFHPAKNTKCHVTRTRHTKSIKKTRHQLAITYL